MKRNQTTFLILLTAGIALAAWMGNAQTFDEQMKVARTALNADRKATVAEALRLTEQEGKAFWPLYERYSAEMQKHLKMLSFHF